MPARAPTTAGVSLQNSGRGQVDRFGGICPGDIDQQVVWVDQVRTHMAATGHNVEPSRGRGVNGYARNVFAGELEFEPIVCVGAGRTDGRSIIAIRYRKRISINPSTSSCTILLTGET